MTRHDRDVFLSLVQRYGVTAIAAELGELLYSPTDDQQPEPEVTLQVINEFSIQGEAPEENPEPGLRTYQTGDTITLSFAAACQLWRADIVSSRDYQTRRRMIRAAGPGGRILQQGNR